MSRPWSSKDQRQYQHILKGQLKDGVSEKRAKQIAARTVNKQRRTEGRTPSPTTQGTGSPHLRLENRSKQELYNRARELKIDGRSSMSKDELITAIRNK